ncbi:putative membrane protein [Paenarthrobacter nicotinovorans]|uniref:Membrane protein n=1 Tax=Paenarthrobacter nicotinovorans TaxID=29320 RepID=A0ABT9TGL2_PAENI|nr:SdpI family protein [Paenarthrobacter nicotinovorans]MDQ0100394.1 putative membrane protein [Paenarthrobacter nicotinovorans]
MQTEFIQLIVILGAMGALLIVMGSICIKGKLPMNSLVGIRLPATTVSEEAWVAGHKAAGPYVIVGGICSAAGAAAILLFPTLEPPTLASITAAGVVLFTVVAAFVASGAAKRESLSE